MHTPITYHHNLISLETQIEADMQSIVSRFFPRFGDFLRDSMKSVLSLSSIKRVDLDSKRFLELANTFNYADLENYAFVTPNALKVDYLTYVKAVLALSRHTKEIYPTSLTPLKKHVSNLVSMQTARLTLTPNAEFSTRIKSRLAIEKDVYACFEKSKAGALPYRSVIKRNADWVAVFAEFKALQNVPQVDAAQLHKDVQELVTLIDTLVEMANAGEFQRAGKQVITNTSEMISHVAEEVALVATEYYHRTALSTALAVGIEKFIKDFR